MVTKFIWCREEAGWYTHPRLGGICQEQMGEWLWYPPLTLEIIGPFKTLREAKEAAERTENGNAK